MKLKKDLLEKEIQKQILNYLWTIGAYAGKTKTRSFKYKGYWIIDKYMFVGFPDITCFYKQNLFFIEVKKKGNKQTKQQVRFQYYCRLSHIKYILAYSLDDVIEALK